MSGRRPRVLYIVGPATGGIAAHARTVAAGLRQAGYALACVTTPDAVTDLGGLGLWPAGGKLGWIGALRRIVALARGADIIHAQGHRAGVVAALAALGAPKATVVISWHNIPMRTGWRGWVERRAERFEARRATLITGASPDLVQRAIAAGARQAELAEVAAPGEPHRRGGRRAARAQLAAELGLDPAKVWVLTVSRLAPQKNLEAVVEASAGLGGNVEWIVCGDGDAELGALLMRTAAAAGAPLTLTGRRADVGRIMLAADIFALPSWWEARSLAVQEAMAAGLPLVVSDTGALPELVGDAGVLISPARPQELRDAVGKLAADAALRRDLGTRAKRRHGQLPTPAHEQAGWLERYHRLLSGRQHG